MILIMHNTILAILGVSSGILNLVASVPYFLDILRGNTKPERATWWIWFMLALVSLFAQIAGGARWSLVLAFSSTAVTGATALLSLKYGFGRFHRRDAAAIIVTVIGIAFAFIYDSPLIAVLTVFLIDAIAAGLTVYKTWHAPRTENLTAWSISAVAVTCGLLSVGSYQPAIFLSPLSNFLINISMVSIILIRRREVVVQPTDV